MADVVEALPSCYMFACKIAAGVEEAGMNVKVELELPEDVVDFVDGLVRDGVIGSFSELAEHVLQYRMLMQSPELSAEQRNAVIAMDNELVRRINPRRMNR